MNALHTIRMEFTNAELLNEAIRGSNLEVLQMEGGVFLNRLNRIELSTLCIDYGLCSLGIISRGEMPQDRYTFGLYLDILGGGTFDKTDVKTDDIVYLPPGTELDVFYTHSHQWLTLSFPASIIEPFWALCYGECGEELPKRKALLRTPCPEKTTLVTILRELVANLERREKKAESSVIISTDLAEDLLEICTGLLRANSRPFSDTSAALRKSLLIRRSEEFLNRQSGPVRISGLARALKVSVRTLEYAFKRTYGMGPKKYLHIKNLNRARRNLLNSENVTGMVTEIAMDSGFWHLSQFAKDYRALFGEMPSETLKKNPFHDTLVRVRNSAILRPLD